MLQGAKRDLYDKMHSIQDTLTKRDEEMAELRRVIKNKQRDADKFHEQLDHLKDDQIKLIQQFEIEKEKLFNQKDFRE